MKSLQPKQQRYRCTCQRHPQTHWGGKLQPTSTILLYNTTVFRLKNLDNFSSCRGRKTDAQLPSSALFILLLINRRLDIKCLIHATGSVSNKRGIVILQVTMKNNLRSSKWGTVYFLGETWFYSRLLSAVCLAPSYLTTASIIWKANMHTLRGRNDFRVEIDAWCSQEQEELRDVSKFIEAENWPNSC